MSLLAAGCGDDDPPTAVVGGTRGSAPGGGGSNRDDGDDESTGSGVSGCDPYEDPSSTCGSGQECSFFDRACYATDGANALDAACTTLDPLLRIDTCTPALICAVEVAGADTGRCVQPCDIDSLSPGCGATSACIDYELTTPRGVCFAGCSLLAPVCPTSGDGCFPLIDHVGTAVSGCVPAGFSDIGEDCADSFDCQAGLTCTDAELHTDLCGGSARCCTSLCDTSLVGDCVGLDTTCQPLGVTSSPTAGFCQVPT